MSEDLVIVESENVLAAFVSGDGLDPIIEQARTLVDEFEPDITTDKGRKAVASLAARVASLKVKLDDLGKDLVGDWKAKAKIVDGSRKAMRDQLDALKIEARAPLTEWENKEKERVQAHREAIDRIDGWVNPADSEALSLEGLKLSLSHVVEVDTSLLEEFELEGVKKKASAIEALDRMILAEQKRIDTEAELERFRQEEEKRKQQEHEDRIRLEAAEAAKVEAENKARAETEQVEREKQEAIEREEKAKADAAESERNRILADERSRVEAEQAEKRRIEAEKQSKIDADAAAERARLAEAQRQKDAEQAEVEAARKREADRTHVGKIRSEAKAALMEFAPEEAAKQIVLAINSGEIPHITINY